MDLYPGCCRARITKVTGRMARNRWPYIPPSPDPFLAKHAAVEWNDGKKFWCKWWKSRWTLQRRNLRFVWENVTNNTAGRWSLVWLTLMSNVLLCCSLCRCHVWPEDVSRKEKDCKKVSWKKWCWWSEPCCSRAGESRVSTSVRWVRWQDWDYSVPKLMEFHTVSQISQLQSKMKVARAAWWPKC